MEALNFGQIYKEIVSGTSPLKTSYIKHYDHCLLYDLEKIYTEEFQRVQKAGAKSEKELISEAIKSGKWDARKEKEVESINRDSLQMENSKKKIYTESQIDSIEEILDEYKRRKEEIYKERYLITNSSAENHANQISREKQILLTLYSDKEFNNFTFSEEEFDYLNELQFRTIFYEYHNKLSSFSWDSLKKLSLEAFFVNLYSLCGENKFNFFGKPVVELTYFQANLLKVAQYYTELLLEHPDFPEKYNNHPGKLVSWHYYKMNVKEDEQAAIQKNDAQFRHGIIPQVVK